MKHRMLAPLASFLLAWVSVGSLASQAAEPPQPLKLGLQLNPGDSIAYIGNTLADRMQHHAWLETYLHALHPQHNLTFRNLAFPGDELKLRPREENFGSPDQWLSKVRADVVFSFFGYNEALKGDAGLDAFRRDLAEVIDGMLAQKYNGRSAPKLVFFSPIAHEDLRSRHLPNGSANNHKLALYTQAMQEVCQAKGVGFVDLFTPTRELYAAASKPLTMNGIHLLERGDKAVAEVIVKELFQADVSALDAQQLGRLHDVVLDKNYYWFSRYRVVDGYNVFGGRSKLAWFGQSNADVMMREMEIFDVLTANRDQRVWAVARGGDLELKDDNLPEELVVQTNKPGPLEGGRFPYLDPREAISQMKVAAGIQVNLFASEKMFPELVNPVQMAVDPDGRLFVSVWPSYPHWNPTEPRRDRIICLPDEDGDGVADKCVIFADELNSVTGFEFWGGGMLVAALPELWFLKDTDGDDKADVKIRMLQGLSSADSHHSANAMVLGPDGWLYWSRGIFNVATMETPTRTYRSTQTGVHRFNPRTFEMEFHFPIGPNPHGDVFDQWGYQFANDGTSGTGSYVNIGKGVGNKLWFEKRVRPVAATGILSSSHFPEQNQGNFLICNTIGVLGVLQHEVKYNGADITCEEVEPILLSDDPNFRPSDVEIGGDGALYVADWCNALIGHMQHNMRDPNRDHEHGRIYRVTAQGRPLVRQPKLKGRPIEEVCQAFHARENATRYRARIELSGRDSNEVAEKVAAFAARLDVTRPDDAQALLECLWVFEEHRLPSASLLRTVFRAEEPRVRAAAIRTLGHWGSAVEGWEGLLLEAARDESPLVRAEAVKAAVSFEGLPAAEVIFEVATRPVDPELDTVLKYARGQIPVDKLVQDAINSGQPLSKAAQAYALLNASIDDLLKMDRTEVVYETILSRPRVPAAALRESLTGLASIRNSSPLPLLLKLIRERDKAGQPAGLSGLGQLLAEQPAAELKGSRRQLEELATGGHSDEVRRIGYVALIAADQSGENALFAASKSKEHLRDLLAAVPSIPDPELRGKLYSSVRSLMFELPPNLAAEGRGGSLQQPGIHVDFFDPSPDNVAVETLARLKPKASGIVPEIVMNVPQKAKDDAFALRFIGMIGIPKSGKYTFFTSSDDGSRLYIGDQLVVNNDGLHGMVEKSGTIDLPAGAHSLTVTYFDNGGGDGLSVAWAGPGIPKQKIPADALFVSGGETLHDVAIRSLASIPGHEEQKFEDLAALVRANRSRPAAISVLRTIPDQHWPEKALRDLADNLIGYLSEIPARYRTSGPAQDAIALVRVVAGKLPDDQARTLEDRLQNLDVRVIAIGTVPERMIFDKEIIVVEARKPVEFRFSNSDNMPHNFAILEPGALVEVGTLAEATAQEPGAKERHYIPKSNKILLASRLLEPGQTQALAFEAPQVPGVYPYVCTYPGHWRRMYGALYVVASLEQYQANPEAYLAANPLPLKDEMLQFSARNTEWKYEDLSGVVAQLPHGRAFEVGKSLFRVANCVACHKLNGEGNEVGPDLTKIEPKKHTVEHLLRSMLEPSQEIAEKYQSNVFVLDTGKVVTGMVIEEDAEQVKLLVDPLAKADPVVVRKAEIEERMKSPVSIMPLGLLNKLTQEEILDLLAYIYAKGDQKHMLYQMHHQH
ncbi:MAG: HEAT repeat domain-containing protein [Pirellulaceae bacterium]|nr:HEAT repeat domain-containing protein [Pirellulaceae bacterium]